MPRQLLILRHGKSDWGVDIDDFERPLKKRGRRGAKAIGKWLRTNDLLPNHVCSSPAVRAIDTANRTCKSAGFDSSGIVQIESIYEARLDDLLRVLSACDTAVRRVMIVGHNPGLEDLLLYLTGGHIPIPEDGKYLPTAALAVLEMPEDWLTLEAGSATLHRLLRAKDLMPVQDDDESDV
ncbi:MAG: histidine phosphatase family protein [Gammaproteobacteria bacterium]|nr:histidine phosphatase family protein [Gammaproteobacteria bacterium]MCP5135506.1 histidine phosphatase family protein [Gammaproteobacteria bacterium]